MKVIWIVSYPKSGNTWIRTLLRNYYNLTTDREPRETTDTIPYFYHTVSPKPIHTLTHPELASLRPAAMMHSIALHTSNANPRPALLIKSHLMNADFNGIPLWSPLWAPKVIYVYRDPRDILPSYADHMGIDHSTCVELMNSPLAAIGEAPAVPAVTSTWSNHVKSWSNSKNVEVLHVSYESLHENPSEVLREVLKFCEIEENTYALHDAVEASEFSKLQAEEEKEGFYERTKHQKKFFRRGIVGSYKDEVDPRHIVNIEEDHWQEMLRLGYVTDDDA